MSSDRRSAPASRTRTRRSGPLIRAVCLALGLTFGVSPAYAAPGDTLETAAIKAAFVYNFAKFTTWPPDRFRSRTEPMQLCVQRNDLDLRALMPLEQKHVADHSVRVEVLETGASPDSCHILFASRFRSGAALDALLVLARTGNVLLVSDMPGFADRGGHIGMIERDNRLAFQVNLQATTRAGLKLSSKLLQLAEIVGPEQP